MNQKPLKNNYVLINLIFSGLILIIILYSFLFNTEGQKYPVPSAGEWLSGQALPSRGLSRSFSAIVRFDLAGARQYNPYGLQLFLFFLVQLLLRTVFSLLCLHTNRERQNTLVAMDVLLSLSMFVVCFRPFFVFVAQSFNH